MSTEIPTPNGGLPGTRYHEETPTPHNLARDTHGEEPVRPVLSFYVYEAPVRLWHWSIAFLVFGLSITGYLIGAPLQSVSGDTSELFAMGTIRELHFIFGWLLAIAAVWRAYWAIVGDHHARLIYYIPFWSKQFWQDIWTMVKWYLFIDMKPHRWIGHNPLARAAMFACFTLGSLFMIVSGFGMYGEQLGLHSWVSGAFGWTLSVAGSSMELRFWHHLGMYLLLIFSGLHIYMAIRDDIMGRVSTISSMISGWRTFRDFKE